MILEGEVVTTFLTSLVLVFLAEMGDKTQFLAMAFAAKFRVSVVLWGIFTATIVNHFFAVEIGIWLTRVISLHYIQILASASFVLFGLWMMHGDTLGDEATKYQFSPFWTVTILFFIAEIGDKTQLATVSLAAKYHTFLPVWLGTTAGMVLSDAVGIVAGIVLGKKIPERIIRWGTAAIFILFGLYGLYKVFFPIWND